MANETEPDDIELEAYRQLKRIADAGERIADALEQLPEYEGALLVTISGSVHTEGK